jgi:hypothetical protein
MFTLVTFSENYFRHGKNAALDRRFCRCYTGIVALGHAIV